MSGPMSRTMTDSTLRVIGLDAGTYRRHWLHDPARPWPKTNCYADVFIEMLSALGLDPLPSMAFLLEADFDGEQWPLFKHPFADLDALYGIRVGELNGWRPLIEHVETHLGLGHLLTIDADTFHLPDAVDAYGRLHQKSTIIAESLDRRDRHLGYFHNDSYFELGGDDFDGVLATHEPVNRIIPYVEIIRLDRLQRRPPAELHTLALERARTALDVAPTDNPIRRLGARIASDIPWLASEPVDTFHLYAFATLRQLGAWSTLVAEFVDWIAGAATADPNPAPRDWAERPSAPFRRLAGTAKSTQFRLARVTTGRTVDVAPAFETMSADYETGRRGVESLVSG